MKSSAASKKAVEAVGVVDPDVHRGIRLDRVRSTKLLEYLDKVKVSYDLPAGGDHLDKLKAAVDAYVEHVKNLRDKGVSFVECVIKEDGCGALSCTDDECPVCGMRDANEDESAALAKADEEEKALDVAVAEVRQLAENAAANFWEMGKKLADMLESKLYLKRLQADRATPKYTSWDKFCAAELQFSGKHVRNAISISKLFPEETVRQIGAAKLGIIAAVKPEHRDELLKLAKDGQADHSLRRIKDAVRELKLLPGETRQRATSTAVGQTGDSAARRAPEPARAERDGEVTAVFALGKTELMLKKRGKKMVGQEELVNGLVITYSFNPETGVLAIDRSRPEES